MSAHRKYAALQASHQASSGQAGSTHQAWKPPAAAPPAAPVGTPESLAAQEVRSHPQSGRGTSEQQGRMIMSSLHVSLGSFAGPRVTFRMQSL